ADDAMDRVKLCDQILLQKLHLLSNEVLRTNRGITERDMEEAFKQSIGYRAPRFFPQNDGILAIVYSAIFVVVLFIITPFLAGFLELALGMRCIVPNNYLIWEATRPVSNCDFCRGVDRPIILQNLTREEFHPYAYSSRPIIIKRAVSHWPAVRALNYTFLKDLYLKHPAALDSLHEDCQFLHFKSNFQTLRDVFRMSDERAEFRAGQQPWYVGWSNCNPAVLAELRKLYPKPHFLPDDAEMPNTDFVFLGYEQGAVMHIDYIPRLMWQAQLRGNKSWILAPTPECDAECRSFSFYVEPGDALLVDTRLWYHGTFIHSKGEFSLTIQSEYG
ncbi:AGAP011086-PA, partial [Anopheles gambiae str. PEST]